MLAVGAILREPLEATLRFVNWYLEQGADQIHLCFDDPKDPAIELLQHHDRVHCIPCTRRFWRSIGVRPRARFTLRQNAALQHVYDGLSEGWFLNVDGDEFVFLEQGRLKDALAKQPDSVRGIMIRPAEPVQCPDTPGVLQCRMSMPRWCCREVYGDLGSALQKRRGLSGHWVGKSVTRTGFADHKVRQHFLQTPDRLPLTDVVWEASHGAYLLHFVDQGYEAWRAKLDWRLSSRGFRREMMDLLEQALNSARPEQALRRIYDTMFVLDRSQLAKLDRAQARFAVDLRGNEHLARHFAPVVAMAEMSAA